MDSIIYIYASLYALLIGYIYFLEHSYKQERKALLKRFDDSQKDWFECFNSLQTKFLGVTMEERQEIIKLEGKRLELQAKNIDNETLRLEHIHQPFVDHVQLQESIKMQRVRAQENMEKLTKEDERFKNFVEM